MSVNTRRLVDPEALCSLLMAAAIPCDAVTLRQDDATGNIEVEFLKEGEPLPTSWDSKARPIVEAAPLAAVVGAQRAADLAILASKTKTDPAFAALARIIGLEIPDDKKK